MALKKVVVIGGGFAGINFIEKLDDERFEVLLIDKLNHHQFQPLFYQVATSQLEPSSISFPLRKIFQGRKNMEIRMADVQNINTRNNLINTSIGDFTYDYLVIATGCKTNFYGNADLEKYAFGLKSTYDAIKIRNSVLQSFEDFLTASEEQKEYLLNIVIVGGGPTGVELAGSFAEIKKNILPKDYPNIDFNNLTITLLEGSAHTLNAMSDLAKSTSQEYLESLGVKVKTNTIVKSYDGKIVTLNSDETIKAKHVIWSAGIVGNLIPGIDEKAIINRSRIKVNRFNLVDGTANIYALGDIAYMETPLYPKGHPQVANVAINQGKNLAKNFKAILENRGK